MSTAPNSSINSTWFQSKWKQAKPADKVIWYSHLLKQFVVIHTVKGFSVVNEAEVDVFLEFPCFLYDQTIWSLGPLLFLNPVCTSGSSQFMYCWSLTWWILSITLLACEMSAIVWQFEHSLALPFFGTGMKTDLFQSYGYKINSKYIIDLDIIATI